MSSHSATGSRLAGTESFQSELTNYFGDFSFFKFIIALVASAISGLQQSLGSRQCAVCRVSGMVTIRWLWGRASHSTRVTLVSGSSEWLQWHNWMMIMRVIISQSDLGIPLMAADSSSSLSWFKSLEEQCRTTTGNHLACHCRTVELTATVELPKFHTDTAEFTVKFTVELTGERLAD